MSLVDELNKIRAPMQIDFTFNQKILHALIPFVLGVILGFLSKYTEDILYVGEFGDFLNILSNIASRIGLWVLIATIISAWSRTSKAGALHILLFFCSMLLTYYTYSMTIFGFFPSCYFLRWGSIALASTIAAYIVWFSRGNGWIASFCASLPIGLLLATGYGFFHTFSAEQGFDLFSAFLLYAILPTNILQRLRMIPFIVVTFFVFEQERVLYLLFGGL